VSRLPPDKTILIGCRCNRSQGTVPLGRKGTGTFFGLRVRWKKSDERGQKMSQSPAACKRLRSANMKISKMIFGTILCIVGILFVLFELAMTGSEPDAFMHGGWIPFLVFLVIGIIRFVGGLLLLKH
jgi:hypothetical protein